MQKLNLPSMVPYHHIPALRERLRNFNRSVTGQYIMSNCLATRESAIAKICHDAKERNCRLKSPEKRCTWKPLAHETFRLDLYQHWRHYCRDFAHKISGHYYFLEKFRGEKSNNGNNKIHFLDDKFIVTVIFTINVLEHDEKMLQQYLRFSQI